MLKNFKYYAGLLDSDGSGTLHITKNKDGTFRAFARVVYTQRSDRAPEALGYLAGYYGVTVQQTTRERNGTECHASVLSLCGTKAVSHLQELQRHLVIKDRIASFLIENNSTLHTQESLKALKKELAALRSDRTPTKKVFPSRKWLAGYMDGDGCIHSYYDARKGSIQFRAVIGTHINDLQGIELIAKQFGGHITFSGNTAKWALSLGGYSNKTGERFLEYFGKHLRFKRAQSDLVLGCLRDRRYMKRHGATAESNLALHNLLCSMKKPQRLNETDPSVGK